VIKEVAGRRSPDVSEAMKNWKYKLGKKGKKEAVHILGGGRRVSQYVEEQWTGLRGAKTRKGEQDAIIAEGIK